MPDYRTLDSLEEDYFRDHPDEIGPYLSDIFEAFSKDSDAGALLASLRTVARVKGTENGFFRRNKPLIQPWTALIPCLAAISVEFSLLSTSD